MSLTDGFLVCAFNGVALCAFFKDDKYAIYSASVIFGTLPFFRFDGLLIVNPSVKDFSLKVYPIYRFLSVKTGKESNCFCVR